MTKLPCFLFNVRDWLCSPSVNRMTDKQYRCYHQLLCYSWIEVPRATLPNNDAELARLLHLSQEEWDQMKGPILAKFTADGEGRIFNERLMQESILQAQNVKSGKKGWTPQRRAAASDRMNKVRKLKAVK